MEKQTNIPQNWAMPLLQEVADINPTFDKSSLNDDLKVSFVPMPAVEAETGRIDVSQTRKFGEVKKGYTPFQREDVLFAKITPCMENGKMAVVPELHNGIGFGSTEFHVLRAYEGVGPNFLYYFVSSKSFRYDAEHNMTGAVGQKRVPTPYFEKCSIPLPPTNEQKRIVAKIEELLSELDKGIENLKIADEQLKIYRQAVLKHAFEGKLTTRWREQNKYKLESTDQLFERIKQEREAYYQIQLEDWKASIVIWETNGKEGKQPSQPKSPDKIVHIREEDLKQLPKLPQGWVWIKLLNISKDIQIRPFGSLLHKHDYVADGWPLVNPSHIKNQRIYPDNNLTITAEKLKELTNYRLQEGDVVMGRRGEMGRCAVVTKKEAGWLCGTGSLFVRLLDSYSSWFYCQALSSQRAKEYLSSSSIGTTMQNLNQKILYEMPVPVCSVEEQIEIMKEIERQFSVIDGLEETISSELHKSEALRQSILKKAFSGKLVAQDPNDEPASVLLGRIRAEKEAQKTESKKPKAKREAA